METRRVDVGHEVEREKELAAERRPGEGEATTCVGNTLEGL